MLAYDLVSNEAEWIPVQGMVTDLSQAEEAPARELSNMVLHDWDEGAMRLDWFGEQRSKSGEEDNINDNDGPRKALRKLLMRRRQEMNK